MLTFAPGVAGKIRPSGPIGGCLAARTHHRARGLRPRGESAALMVCPRRRR
ncbi:conserved domain protein [Actinomyces sp. oral taxon 175 str. F0384]|nr:conserved domain protein [Actinomyces sp. oral taxon 175 str. F0384]